MKTIRPLCFLTVFLAVGLLLTTPTNGSAAWWDKLGEPEYGGTLTVQLSTMRLNFDTYSFFPGDWHMVYEGLIAQENWTVDREEYAFNADFVPMKYFTGELAESWELTDPKTLIVKVRQGVRWHNKPPTNGREFTAHDVQHHYDRCLALGGGYTTPSYMYTQWLNSLESVTATDRYTVTVKFNKAGVASLWQFMDQVPMNLIEAPEYAALGGKDFAGPPKGGPGGPPKGDDKGGPGGPPKGDDKGGPPGEKGGAPKGGPPKGGPPVPGAGGPLQDWHNIVGTGPWMLTDFIPDASKTLSRNPDYWCYDERHPKNKLPYVDTLKGVVIRDIATAMAALRTGKVDIMGGPGGVSSIVNWQQVESLKKTNPDLAVFKLPAGGGGVEMRVDKAPFTDIRVRKALNMAIDRPTIAKGYYGGTEDPTPAGLLHPTYKGFAYPYEEWPQEIRDIFSYNPEGAKKLLAEAGFPDGFKTHVVAASNAATDLLQIIKSYFMEIGVDMEIRVMDPTAYQNFIITRKSDQMINGGCAATFKPANIVFRYFSTDVNMNVNAVNDPEYDKLVNQFNSALTEDEAAAAFKAADKYSAEQVWSIRLFPTSTYVILQPYLKGFTGEAVMWNHCFYYPARWWIDKKLKTSMGR